MRARLAAVAVVAAGLLAPRAARANPLDTFGFGSRETAMGGAVSADVHDFSAGYYNPAGLAHSPFEIAIGYFRAVHDLRTNGKNNNVDPVAGLSGGLVVPGKVLGFPVAFGLALHLPDDRISRVRALRQEEPRWELYDNRNQRLYLAANVAISPWPWLEVGGGVCFMSATEGRLDITGEANLLNVSQSELRHEVSADLTAVRYPQLGVRVKVGRRAALALVYRGQFSLDLDLSARLQGDISLGAQPLTSAYYALQEHSVDAFLPQQVVLGSSFELTPALHANLDLTWINWSAYESPVADLKVNLDIPPPAGGWPAGITPPTVPAPTQLVPLVLHDRIVPHLGVEWRAVRVGKWDGLVRAGYEFQKSPIEPQTGVTNYIDRDRHSVSLGLGVRVASPAAVLPGDVRLDLHAQLSILPEEVTAKADPADLVGDYTAGGFIWNLGTTLSVGF